MIQPNMITRIKGLIERLETCSLRSGDILGPDDLQVMAFIGYPVKIVDDENRLLSALNDTLVYLTNND